MTFHDEDGGTLTPAAVAGVAGDAQASLRALWPQVSGLAAALLTVTEYGDARDWSPDLTDRLAHAFKLVSALNPNYVGEGSLTELFRDAQERILMDEP